MRNSSDSAPDSVIYIHHPQMPRTQKPTGKSRHDPLHVDIAADDSLAKHGNVSKPGRRKKSRHDIEQNGEEGGEVSSLFLPMDSFSPYSLPAFSDHLRFKGLQAHL